MNLVRLHINVTLFTLASFLVASFLAGRLARLIYSAWAQ